MASYGSKRNADLACAQEGKGTGKFSPVFRVPKKLSGVLPSHHHSPISFGKTHTRKQGQEKNLERAG